MRSRRIVEFEKGITRHLGKQNKDLQDVIEQIRTSDLKKQEEVYGTCEWWDGECNNEDSPRYEDSTDEDDSCEFWEE
jgi:hypothetical protein